MEYIFYNLPFLPTVLQFIEIAVHSLKRSLNKTNMCDEKNKKNNLEKDIDNHTKIKYEKNE